MKALLRTVLGRSDLLALAFVALGGCGEASATGAQYGVGPQYDTTHVYVAADQVAVFAASFLATFGGTSSPQSLTTVTPTPSQTSSQLLHTPVGPISLFGFTTPVPFPFGAERTGYLVNDLDAAVGAARAAGASVLVAPFPDAIGRDVVIQWPGGVEMQLYSHTEPPRYAALETIPENRIYVAQDRADEFVHAFVAFSRGRVSSDDRQAAGSEIGRRETHRRLRIESAFGALLVIATDGHVPYPYGRETTGYGVRDLAATIARATASGARVLVEPRRVADRETAMVEFPGGYIAELHGP